MLQVRENLYLFKEPEVSINVDIKTEKSELDLEIQRTETGFKIFSLRKIKEISLFDLSGRIIKLGDRINDHKYHLVYNYNNIYGMPLFIKVNTDSGYEYRRI